MSCVEHTIPSVNSTQEEFSYHFQEACYHLDQLKKAVQEINWHMHLYQGHIEECKKNSSMVL